jgi:hypothetical protein
VRGAAIWWCVLTGAKELIWPAVGLIVSAHLFHVRACATAVAGIVTENARLFVESHRSQIIHFTTPFSVRQKPFGA